MIKASLFFCCIFILVQYGNSTTKDECTFDNYPDTGRETRFKSNVTNIDLEKISNITYFSHRLWGNGSILWASEHIRDAVTSKKGEEAVYVNTTFTLKGSQISIACPGSVHKSDQYNNLLEVIHQCYGISFTKKVSIISMYQDADTSSVAVLAYMWSSSKLIPLEHVVVLTNKDDYEKTPAAIKANITADIERIIERPLHCFKRIDQDNRGNGTSSISEVFNNEVQVALSQKIEHPELLDLLISTAVYQRSISINKEDD